MCPCCFVVGQVSKHNISMILISLLLLFQGLWIFVVFVIRPPAVRALWMDFLCCRTRRRDSLRSSSTWRTKSTSLASRLSKMSSTKDKRGGNGSQNGKTSPTNQSKLLRSTSASPVSSNPSPAFFSTSRGKVQLTKSKSAGDAMKPRQRGLATTKRSLSTGGASEPNKNVNGDHKSIKIRSFRREKIEISDSNRIAEVNGMENDAFQEDKS